MIDFILYAFASFYFIWSTLERASLGALSAAASVPFLQSTSAFKSIDTTVRTVVLPSTALSAVTASALSLLTYPAVSLVNGVLQAFVYWLALMGFVYLSVSQNEKAFQFVTEHCIKVASLLKTHAPQQFEKLVGAGFALVGTSSTNVVKTVADAEKETTVIDDEKETTVTDDEEEE